MAGDVMRRYVDSDPFYESREWRELRYRVFKEHGGKCGLCGRTAKDGAVLHVDHIKPRSKHPELELVFENLQILCEDCNLGKSNRDDSDWRKNKIPIPKKDNSFVQVPRDLLRSEAFQNVGYSGQVLFMYMKDSMFDPDTKYRNVKDFSVMYGPACVMKYGMNKRTFYNALNKLICNGVVSCTHPGGHGKQAIYDLTAWRRVMHS
jgi:hypothetical protein